MKLIDLLVQELPKRGGWPCAIPVLVQSSSGYVYQAGGGEFIYQLELADDWMDAEITCEKYCDALRALKPIWDGEGLPPVGCRVEALCGDKWVEATVAYTDRPEGHGGATVWKEALVFDCKTTKPFWTDEFRPIRSEEDKKRDEVIKNMSHSLRANGSVTEEQLNRLYADIAAGNIPHIRIE